MRLAILLFIICFFYSPAYALEDSILLGIGTPMSGPISSIGEDIKFGVNLAVDDINAQGGVLGKKLKPLFEDDACDPKVGVTVANRFITQKVSMAADICSKVCMVQAPIYAEENIPFLNECNTDAVTMHGWSNVIRVYVKNSQEAPKLAELITKKQNQRKLALVYFSDEYNSGLAQDIIDKLAAEHHVNSSARIELPESTEDFSSIITKLKDQKVGVVYLGLWSKAVGLFLRQSAASNYHPLFVGNTASSLDEVQTIAGTLTQDMIFTMPLDPQNIPSAQPLIKEMADKNWANRPFAVYAYLLVEVFAEAAKKAGSVDGLKILQTLKSEKFNTIVGPIQFNKNGDMIGIDFDFYQWRQGKIIPLQ